MACTLLGKVQKNARQKNVIAPPSPPLKNVTGAAQTQNDEKIAATWGEWIALSARYRGLGPETKKNKQECSEIE